jgi:hypothetical protein
MNMQIPRCSIEVVCFKIHAQSGNKGKAGAGQDTGHCGDLYVNNLNQGMAQGLPKNFV